jgi:hypothetical protein
VAEKTIFQKIGDGNIPVKMEYQDEHCFCIGTSIRRPPCTSWSSAPPDSKAG